MAGESDKIDRVRFEISQLYYFKGATVSRLKADFGRTIGIKSLLPSRGAKTPAVAGFESRKSELGSRCGQIVSPRTGEL